MENDIQTLLEYSERLGLRNYKRNPHYYRFDVDAVLSDANWLVFKCVEKKMPLKLAKVFLWRRHIELFRKNLRQYKKYKNTIFLLSYTEDDAYDDQRCKTIDDKDELLDFENSLDEKEKMIFRFMWEGMTQREIRAVLRIDTTKVAQYIKDIRAKGGEYEQRKCVNQ